MPISYRRLANDRIINPRLIRLNSSIPRNFSFDKLTLYLRTNVSFRTSISDSLIGAMGEELPLRVYL